MKVELFQPLDNPPPHIDHVTEKKTDRHFRASRVHVIWGFRVKRAKSVHSHHTILLLLTQQFQHCNYCLHHDLRFRP